MKRVTPLVLLALLLPSASAYALFGNDRQLVELREEFNTRLESLNRSQLELSSQNELLKTELAGLRGQIEVLTHELDMLKQSQRDFYVDLDNRIRRFEPTSTPAQSGAATPPGVPSLGAPSFDPVAESKDYEAALNLLKSGKNREALAGFEHFLTQHMSSHLLPNANFWAGNAALQAAEIALARNYFSTVIQTWPDNPIAADAMLGLANSQQALGEARLSRQTLESILQQYPDSSAAQVAAQRLGQPKR